MAMVIQRKRFRLSGRHLVLYGYTFVARKSSQDEARIRRREALVFPIRKNKPIFGI